jgi:type IV pilus assembly protein PilX
MSKSYYSLDPRHTQRGAALIIALVFLLIITMVTIANMREVSLESRITANTIESKRLLNIAESAVRNGERSLQLVDSDGEIFFSPPSQLSDCAAVAAKDVCVLDRDPGYALDITEQRQYSSGTTTLEGDAHYYVLTAPAGSTRGEAENPEYGNQGLQNIGIYRYEVNGTAERNQLTTAIRSTVAFYAEGKLITE